LRKLAHGVIGLGVTAIIVLTGSMTAAQATTGGQSVAGRAVVIPAQHTDEEVFRGAIFGQGEVGELLEDLVPVWVESEEVAVEVDNIVADIANNDPAYFGDFATLVQSGEVLQVKEAFDGVGEVLEGSLVRLGYEEASESGEITPQCIQVVLVIAAVVAYAAAAILQFGAVATTALYSTKVKTISGPKSSDLTYDVWLAGMTVTLAKA